MCSEISEIACLFVGTFSVTQYLVLLSVCIMGLWDQDKVLPLWEKGSVSGTFLRVFLPGYMYIYNVTTKPIAEK